MDGTGNHHVEQNKTQKDKYYGFFWYAEARSKEKEDMKKNGRLLHGDGVEIAESEGKI
jgi:hypothetical protein